MTLGLATALMVLMHMEEDVTEWRRHNGFSDPPIPGDTKVEVMFRDGETAIGVMHDWDQNWQWQDTEEGNVSDGAIVSYRVLEGKEE